MDLNNIHEDWEKEAPVLASLGRTNPFIVPENYFEDLHDNLSVRMKIGRHLNRESSELFSTPPDYFDTLAERINTSIKADSLKQTTADPGFSVPGGFFGSLEERILQKTALQEKQGGKIRKLYTGWARYAAAACIIAVSAVTLFINKKETRVEDQFSGIPDTEIVNYLQAYSEPGDGMMIIENLGSAAESAGAASDLPEDEIQHYLESTL